MHPALKAMLNQTISKRTPTSYDAGGTEVLGDPVEFLAYIENYDERIVAPDGGREIISHTLIICDTEITMDDRVYLPGQNTASDEGVQRPKKVVAFTDPKKTTIHHYEVFL